MELSCPLWKGLSFLWDGIERLFSMFHLYAPFVRVFHFSEMELSCSLLKDLPFLWVGTERLFSMFHHWAPFDGPLWCSVTYDANGGLSMMRWGLSLTSALLTESIKACGAQSPKPIGRDGRCALLWIRPRLPGWSPSLPGWSPCLASGPASLGLNLTWIGQTYWVFFILPIAFSIQNLPFVIHQNSFEQYQWPRPGVLIGRNVGVARPRMVVKASGPKASSTSTSSSSSSSCSSSSSSTSSSSCSKASANH